MPSRRTRRGPGDKDTGLARPDASDWSLIRAIVVSDRAPNALVPEVRALDGPAPGLHDAAPGNKLRPRRMLRDLPGSGEALAGVANDAHGQARGLHDGLGAAATVSGSRARSRPTPDPGACPRDHRRSGAPVLRGGGGGLHFRRQAEGIDNEPALDAARDQILDGLQLNEAAIDQPMFGRENLQNFARRGGDKASASHRSPANALNPQRCTGMSSTQCCG